jgi:5-methylcytosine-specific restriction endonuclease McrA
MIYGSVFAFSPGTRRQILERDRYQCRVCGDTNHPEASHIDHNKNNPKYDHPSNGRILCTEHHLADHINRHGRNGLTKSQNIWAINKIRERL